MSIQNEKLNNAELNNMFAVSESDLIGELKDFPPEVVELMLKRQYEQTGKVDVKIFQENVIEGCLDGGFFWRLTVEDHDFWKNVIYKKRFDIFFNRYPKKQPAIIEAILAEQERQRNELDVQDYAPIECVAFLSKKVGEVSTHALEAHFSGAHMNGDNEDYEFEQLKEYRKKLIQVAALAITMIESIDKAYSKPKRVYSSTTGEWELIQKNLCD